MPAARRSSKKTQLHRSEPAGTRPRMPPGYGVPKHNKGLLPWSHVDDRMTKARQYWVCTVSPDGRPHSTPVDGLWIDGRLYCGGSPLTRRHRNLIANPSVCVHLESATDVIILHGEARELRAPGRALAARLAEGTREKYGYAMRPEYYEKAEGVFEFRPRVVLAWSHFPKDVTRWQLRNDV